MNTMTTLPHDTQIRAFELLIEACKMFRLDWISSDRRDIPEHVRECYDVDKTIPSVGYGTFEDGREMLAVVTLDEPERPYVEVHVWSGGRDGLHGWQFFEYRGIGGFTD